MLVLTAWAVRTDQAPAIAAYHTALGRGAAGWYEPSRVPVGWPVEITLARTVDYGSQQNVDDVAVTVTFAPPGRRPEITVGGFYYWTTDDGRSLWKARFAPMLAGRWTYRWRFRHDPSGEELSGQAWFDAVGVSGDDFVRSHPDRTFPWLLGEGAYAPIGFNDCLGISDVHQIDGGDRFGAFAGTTAAEDYMTAYADAGFDLYRFSPSNCSPQLITSDMQRLDSMVAMYFDSHMALLRAHGFRIYYGLFGSLLPNDPPVPLSSELERFVRYSVDRWGALVDFWELENERSASAEWIGAVAALIRDRDPYRHPITTSNPRAELAAVEINAPHWYQTEASDTSDAAVSSRAASWRASGKPVIVGEQGNSTPQGDQYGNWLPESALRMRLRSWAALFHGISLVFWNNTWATNGTGGGAANIYLGREERQAVFVLQWFARIVGDAALVAPDPSVVIAYDSHALRVHGLSWGKGIGLYLHHYADHSQALSGAVVTVQCSAGTGYWIDPASGRLAGTVVLSSGRNDLVVPDFAIDLALVSTSGRLEVGPIASMRLANPQDDGDLDEDGLPDRGPRPQAFGLPPLTLTLDAGDSYDLDGGPVSVSWDFGDGSAGGTGPVVTHTWADGHFEARLSVTDDEGNVAHQSFAVRASADPHPDHDDPPTLNPLHDVTTRETNLVLITPVGSDRELVGGSYNVDGHTTETLSYFAADLPSGARFEPIGQGRPHFWWVPGLDQAGDYQVRFWVEDPAGNASAMRTVAIHVLDAESPGAPIWLPSVQF
jgi:hypothetical protein